MEILLLLPAMALGALTAPLSNPAWLFLYGLVAAPLALHRRWSFKLAAAAALYYAAFSLAVAVEVSGQWDRGLLWVLFGGPSLVLAAIGAGVWWRQMRRHGIADEQDHARAVLARLTWRLGLNQVEPPPVTGGTVAAWLRRSWYAWRATSIILPDGSQGTIIINSRSEQLKIVLRLVQLGALVIGIIYARSIWEWVGERAAGNSSAIARGAVREFGRQLGF